MNISLEKFIGRKDEVNFILNYLENTKSSLGGRIIGITGMRRVGKTTLVNHVADILKYEKDIFYINFIGYDKRTSLENLKECVNELKNFIFLERINLTKKDRITEENLNYIKNWDEFFLFLYMFVKTLEEKHPDKKIMIFYDEICWFSKKDNFINAFQKSWNKNLMHCNNLIYFLAGSKISWMKDKLFENKVEFYNRIDLIIELKPFDLIEIKKLIRNSLKISEHSVSDEDIIKYFNIFGGIAKYYYFINFNLSFEQNFERFLKDKNLFEQINSEKNALFENVFSEKRWHREIMKCFCSSKSLTLAKLVEKLKNQNNDKVINESTIYIDLMDLVYNQLIYKNNSGYNIKYNLNSNFAYFYFYWFDEKENQSNKIKNFSFENSDYKNWKGSAFEITIFSQIEKILERSFLNIPKSKIDDKNLNITIKNNFGESFQIDLMVDYDDDKYLLFEIKNNNEEIVFSGKEADNIMDKFINFEKKYKKIIVLSLNNVKFSKEKDNSDISFINLTQWLIEKSY